MKSYTKRQIEEFIKTTVESDKVEIKIDGEKVFITLSSMYEPPGLSFAQMKEISVFFETDNISNEDRFSSRGCETCDYGSSYGFTLRVWPMEQSL